MYITYIKTEFLSVKTELKWKTIDFGLHKSLNSSLLGKSPVFVWPHPSTPSLYGLIEQPHLTSSYAALKKTSSTWGCSLTIWIDMSNDKQLAQLHGPIVLDKCGSPFSIDDHFPRPCISAAPTYITLIHDWTVVVYSCGRHHWTQQGSECLFHCFSFPLLVHEFMCSAKLCPHYINRIAVVIRLCACECMNAWLPGCSVCEFLFV